MYSLVLVTLQIDYSVCSSIKHRVRQIVTGKDVLFSAPSFPCPASNALSETDSKQHVWFSECLGLFEVKCSTCFVALQIHPGPFDKELCEGRAVGFDSGRGMMFR